MMTTTTVKIEGMSCGHCTARVEKVLNALPGIRAKVILNDNMAYIESDENINDKAVRDAIEEAGYTPLP